MGPIRRLERGRVTDLLQASMPWALALMREAGAYPWAVHGKLYVWLPNNGCPALMEMTGLERAAKLLPWPDQQQVAH